MSDLMFEVETEAVIHRRDGTIKYREYERTWVDPTTGETRSEKVIEDDCNS